MKLRLSKARTTVNETLELMEESEVNAAGLSEGLLPRSEESVIQVRRICEVGLESEVVRSKFGVSTKFDHDQTNKRHATILI